MPSAKRAPAAALVNKPVETQSAPDSGVSDIPPHVWALLLEAGEEAAQRLVELLQPVRFAKLRDSTQKALIELALTRAYGQPVKRSVNVNLSSDDADAVASSLAGLASALPERALNARDITPSAAPASGEHSGPDDGTT